MATSAYDYEFYDAGAAGRFTELSLGGMKAVFIYSRNVFTGGAPVPYDEADTSVRTVAVEGTVYVPTVFFTKHLGAACEATRELARLTLGGASFECVPYEAGGALCVPVLEAAGALGLVAKAYYDGRMCVVGSPADIAALDADEKMQTAGAYLVFGKYDPYSFTSADYLAAREKIREKLVGTKENIDLDNPTVKRKLQVLDEGADARLASLHREKDRFILWGENPPVESEELHRQYSGLRTLALAFGTYGSKYYQSDEVKATVVDGVRWMYENMYGEAEIAGTGWRDAHLFNWYFWFISAGEFLCDIFAIMGDVFTLEERRTYLKCFNWCSTFMRYWFAREAALSRISVCTKVGIMTEDPKRLFEEFVDFDMLLGLEELGEGPHVDYAQWSHGMPYNNAYGKLNLDRILYIVSALSGTPLEFLNPKQYNQFMVVKYMFEAAMHKGQSMMMFCGRDIHFTEAVRGGEIIADAMQMIGMFGEDEDKYLRRFVKRCTQYPVVLDAARKRLDIGKCALLEDILADGTIDVETPYVYAHAYYTADRAVQHCGSYAVGLAMSSKREKAYESINSANKTGWYTGNGATYLYTDYDRHAYDGKYNLKDNVNIAYRYPGTTEDSQTRVVRSVRYGKEWMPDNSFAGSMQVDDKYIIASMDYISENWDGPDNAPDDSTSGGTRPVHHNDLVAKKSWFCLDGKIVCLGAGITSTMNSPVHTTVEHRRIVNPKTDRQFVNGELLPTSEYEKRYTGPAFVNMEGHAGFILFGEQEAYVHRYHDEPTGQDCFELRLEHGTNPEGKSYAYMIAPYKSCEELDELSRNPGIEILENTDAMQVVRDNGTGITAYVFHKAKDKHGVSANKPCIVTVTDNELYVCDPTHEADFIELTLWREITVTECSDKIDFDIAGGKTVLHVDVRGANGRALKLKFVPYDREEFYRVSFNKKDREEFVALSEAGASALFIYGEHCMVGGKLLPLGEGGLRAIGKGGCVLAPVSFFEDILGLDLSKIDSAMRVRGEFGEYLPAIECARALGLAADSFYEGRLVVIGTEEQIARMHANPNLEEAGAYSLFPKYDASVFTTEDYNVAKDAWRLRLVGSPEINDLSEPAIKGKIDYRNTLCRRALDELNRAEDRIILFGDKPAVESDDLWQQYIKLENLALAWGTYGCENYHSEELLAIIKDGLEWLCENLYGDSVIEGRGWRNVRLFNWWHWFVGAPESLCNVMAIIEEHLTKEDKEKYLKCYRYVRTIMYNDPRDRGGAASRLLQGGKAALLLEDGEMLEIAERDCDACIGGDEYGPGLHKADYINWSHAMPHNISYGVTIIQRTLVISSYLASTKMAFTSPKAYNHFNLVKYCYEPAMYHSQGFVMFSGRSTFANEVDQGVSILLATLPMIGCFGEDEDAYIKRFIKRHAASEEILKKVKAGCSIYDCATLNSILNDDTIPSDNSSYEIGYAWFTGDRAAQHRKDYAVGIAMSSRREKAYECINSANKTGWYTGNGAIYLYTNYDTHQYDGKNFITNNINVAYHFPGTTEDSRPRVIRSISSTDSWYPDNAFAGGVQVGGKYVVAAMDYISMNNEVDEHPDDYGYGGSQPIHLNDLRARKAWFCFDDEIVCLGAGITSTMSSPVNTTAEHRRIVNAEGDKQYMNGELLPTSEYEKRYTGRPYFNMEGHAGYVFLEDTDVYLRRYVCEDAAGQSFIELRAEHGENPTDKTYAYAVLPYATNDVLSEYRNNPDVRIISNTAKCQAVKDASSGVWGYVFYEAGECDGIEVSGPCIVTKHREGNEWVLGVCDATQKQRTLTVTLNEKITVTGKNAKITASEKDGKTLLTVNVFVAHGRRFEIKYN